MASSLPINIDDLLRHRGVESSRVDFKSSWKSDQTRAQVLATICAFANDLMNLNGGYVVLGVDAPQGVAVLPPVGIDPSEIERIQQEIRVDCKRLDPPYQPILSPEKIGEKFILVVWAPASDTRPQRAPGLRAKSDDLCYFVRSGSETVRTDQGPLLALLLEQTAKVPFDDRRHQTANVTDLREGRVREFLAQIRSSLSEELDSREVYRRLRITVPVNAHDAPKNVGLLFFSDDPTTWFAGARVEVAQFADDSGGDTIEERSFGGPLATQVIDVIGYLRSLSTRLIEKHPTDPKTTNWVSYPLPALEEAVVNAIYHRGYDNAEPTKIYLYPDRIEIISYPGPVPGIRPEDLALGNKVPPVPARNRRIGEFLKELRLAEGRGTGLPKIRRAMRLNGSPPPRYDFDEPRSFFRATLPAHPEFVALSALRDAALLRAKGRVADAIARLTATLSEEHLATAVVREIIRLQIESKDYDAALASWDSFSKRLDGSTSASIAASLAESLNDAQRESDARRILDEAPALVDSEAAVRMAVSERRAGRPEAAHLRFEQAGDLVGQDPRALHEFAQTKMDLAFDLFRRRRNAADAAAGIRLLTEAETALQRVIQMKSERLRRAHAWWDLSLVRQRLERSPLDIEAARAEARKLAPEVRRFASE